MPTVMLKIPEQHIEWFRQQVAEESACDLEHEVPRWQELSREALEKLKGLADGAIAIFETIGYIGDPVNGGRGVKVETSEATVMLDRMTTGLGEEMKEATGDYESCSYDAEKVRNVSERGLWLADLREQVKEDD